MRNLRTSGEKAGDHIIFLRKVEPGGPTAATESKSRATAGLPLVIQRAREVLKLHEKTGSR